MKRIQNYVVLLAILAGVLAACQKEVSFETGTGATGPAGWEFKEAGVQFKGPLDTAYYSSNGGITVLTLEGTSTDGKDAFYMEIFGTSITAGTYSTPVVFFEYSSNGTILYTNDPLAVNKFSVTITRIDDVSVTGTFTGEVKDSSGNIKTITDGKFTGKFIDVPPPPPGSGQVMFWAKQGCSGTSLVVDVNGQLDTITTFQTSTPSCGTPGTAFFTLPAGTYSWKAYCAGATDTVRSTTTVTAGTCIGEEVIIGTVPNPTTCKISNIASYDLATAQSLGAIASIFNAQNQVTKTQLTDSTSGTGVVESEFNLTYTASQINIDATQYFTLEPGGGRISQFHGYVNPADDSSGSVIISYTYDASGYMSKATIALKDFPTIPVFEYTYQWTGGNLAKIIMKLLVTGERSEIVYQYDLTKQAKGFLFFVPNSEIIFFQNALNYGKNSANVPTKSTWTDYKADGTVEGAPYVSDFKNYVYDANNYVKSFEITGDGSVYGTDIKHVLSYKCF